MSAGSRYYPADWHVSSPCLCLSYGATALVNPAIRPQLLCALHVGTPRPMPPECWTLSRAVRSSSGEGVEIEEETVRRSYLVCFDISVVRCLEKTIMSESAEDASPSIHCRNYPDKPTLKLRLPTGNQDRNQPEPAGATVVMSSKSSQPHKPHKPRCPTRLHPRPSIKPPKFSAFLLLFSFLLQ